MYEKQMELFEDGGKVDKVSGNDIPLGSTAKEVRDDQPAMLSEGEMVVPADVVRYFGVEYFMNLRDQAKMGYKKMEAMGQFGTEEGQTLPDDTIFNAGGPPFTIEDLEVIEDEDEKEPIKAASGALLSDTVPLVASAVGTIDALSNSANSSGGDDGDNTTADDLTRTGSQTAFTGQQTQNLIGVDNFSYLKSLMPQNILESASDTDLEAAENYSNNIEANVGVTDTGTTSGNGTGGTGGEGPVGTGGPSGGGSTGRAVNAPGTGDIFTMMNNPTAANIQGLKNFGELKDTDAGKAFLSLMGGVVSAGMNPGQYAPVVGLVQRGVSMLEPALFGTNNIGKGFAELRDIPLMQANMATRAVRSFEYQTANMTPEQLEAFNVVMQAQEIGEINDIDISAPGVTVGVTDRGETVVKGPGAFAAAYNRAGEVIGDKISKTYTPEQVKDGLKTGKETVNNMTTAADPKGGQTVDPAMSRGLGGGPQTAAEARGESPDQSKEPPSPGFDFPDDVGGPTGSKGPPSPGFDFPDDVGGPTSGTGTGNVDTSSQVDSFSEMGGNVDTSSQVDSFSEMGGDGDGAGDSGGTGGDGSPGADTDAGNEGGMNKGGFVQKRKTKKKKKRRGLAGR